MIQYWNAHTLSDEGLEGVIRGEHVTHFCSM